MDGATEHATGRGRARPAFWPALWIPLVVTLAGWGASLLLAGTVAQQLTELSRENYRASHRALVANLAARVQSEPGSTLPAGVSGTLAENLPPGIELRVDSLARHTKRALVIAGRAEQPLLSEALRTELRLPERHWMISTTPSSGQILQPAGRMYWRILIAGIGLSLLAGGLTLWLCRKLGLTRHQHRRQQQALAQGNQQLEHLQIEKAILRQALNDSETRSRDLMRLCGALIAELDEQQAISFISAETAQMLGYAPADLLNWPFETLVTEADRGRFRELLSTARQELAIARADLALHHKTEGSEVPVTIRVLALKAPLPGIAGFRLSAIRRSTPD